MLTSSLEGTLTKNEQTVTEAYTVDELIQIEQSASKLSNARSALLKTLQIGNICNSAFMNDEGVNVGQSTDVALLNVLPLFGLSDQRQVSNR